MPTSARVVIGANYGDEGKGLLTDYYASQGTSVLVVRHNGGAQAGHTVETPEGRRHVFSHFGSGTLVGAPTLLSRFFLANPIRFRAEHDALARLGVAPVVFVDPTAPVTTPYDIALNQAAEQHRGASRHGSCGMGINETVVRSMHADVRLVAADLAAPGRVRDALARIREEWIPARLEQLGMTPAQFARYVPAVHAAGLVDRWLDDAAFFARRTSVVGDAEVIRLCETVVFEGAQGLLLDQRRGVAPYQTRSNTGIVNASSLARLAGVTELEVTYVTRAYLTRHGAGPMPNESDAPPAFADATNVPNQWQGALRFAPLDVPALLERIGLDLRDSRLVRTVGIAVTCLDHLESADAESRIVDALADRFGAHNVLASHGPTRADVRGLAVHA